MSYRPLFESWYTRLYQQFKEHNTYQQFLHLSDGRSEAITLIENVCRSHLCSPKILAFLYSITSPNSEKHIQENLLEEIGLQDGEPSHPELLRQLGYATGLIGAKWQAVEEGAELVLKNKIAEPLMFGSIKETGFNIMLEVFAFEWFLSRESSNLGRLLKKYLRLSDSDLTWFFHHSEVDISHAEEGLKTLDNYVQYYEFDKDTIINIGEITFRENIYLKRYFDIQQESLI